MMGDIIEFFTKYFIRISVKTTYFHKKFYSIFVLRLLSFIAKICKFIMSYVFGHRWFTKVCYCFKE